MYMPNVPAFCDSCGAIYNSGIFVGDGCRNISFCGNKVQCPVCGMMGHIPDGVFDFIGDTIKLLSGSQRTIAELQTLNSILQKALKENLTKEKIMEEVESELPGLQLLKSYAPKNSSELCQWITLIITIITIVLGRIDKNKLENVAEQPQIVINQTLINSDPDDLIQDVLSKTYSNNTDKTVIKKERSKATSTSKINLQTCRKTKIGRNALCPCNSGKKYKRCCGGIKETDNE
jgi:uncharacterized protein YecA (UPF0149 family)